MPKRTIAEAYRADLAMLARESQAWESVWERAEFGVKFLMDGRHFSDAREKASLDSDDIRWVGEEAFNRLRHEVGVVVRPGVLTALPVDQWGDAELGDLATKVITSDTDQPENEWEDAWYDVVECGSAAGYGVAWLDHIPDDRGGAGDVLLSLDDPRNFMCDRRVKSVHSPRCRFVARRVRMTIGEAKRRAEGRGGWNKELVAKLRPDDGHDTDWLMRAASHADNTTKAVRLESDSASTSDESDRSMDEMEFTAYFIWRRRSDDTETRTESVTEYAPESRYMRCTCCGYRSEAQGSLPPNDDGSSQELPEVLENGCPECMGNTDISRHGDMVRVDGVEHTAEMLRYPDGLVSVLAPMALPGVEGFLYRGEWPHEMRSYPCVFLPRFRHPFRVTGPSLADLTAWNQIATDMLMRIVLERMVAIEPAPVLPWDVFVDARGNPWEFSTERSLGAFYTGTMMPQTGMLGVDPGIPSAWSPVYNAARNALTSSQGIADFSFSEGQSRDIPAQSAAIQVRQEEIPSADYRRRYEHQRSILTGVYYDMKRSISPGESLARIAAHDGTEHVRAVAIGDLPNFSFRFSSEPDMRPQDNAERAATDALIQTIEQRPWAVDIVAQRNKISPALVRKAQQDFKRWNDEQAAAQRAAAQAQGGSALQPGGAMPQDAAQEAPSSVAGRLLEMAGPQQGG